MNPGGGGGRFGGANEAGGGGGGGGATAVGGTKDEVMKDGGAGCLDGALKDDPPMPLLPVSTGSSSLPRPNDCDIPILL